MSLDEIRALPLGHYVFNMALNRMAAFVRVDQPPYYAHEMVMVVESTGDFRPWNPDEVRLPTREELLVWQAMGHFGTGALGLQGADHV